MYASVSVPEWTCAAIQRILLYLRAYNNASVSKKIFQARTFQQKMVGTKVIPNGNTTTLFLGPFNLYGSDTRPSLNKLSKDFGEHPPPSIFIAQVIQNAKGPRNGSSQLTPLLRLQPGWSGLQI